MNFLEHVGTCEIKFARSRTYTDSGQSAIDQVATFFGMAKDGGKLPSSFCAKNASKLPFPF